jgi:microcystin-dependent protein
MPLKNGRTTASLQTILVGSVIPAGTIAPFGGGTVPAGWLLCDGSTVSRTVYPNLFAAVGTLHGQGNGTTTFHLPDYRGRFLRGADDMGTGAAGRDPNAAVRTAANAGGATGAGVGSVQDSDNKTHTHVMAAGRNGASLNNNQQFPTTVSPLGGDALTQATGNSAEARPQNANVEYIIKV